MSFVHIKPKTKLDAVKLYWQSGNITKSADKFGVSRNTVYDWVHLAEQHLENVFRESTPGRRAPSLDIQNQALQSQIDHVLEVYHNISPKPQPLPQSLARCPKCRS